MKFSTNVLIRKWLVCDELPPWCGYGPKTGPKNNKNILWKLIGYIYLTINNIIYFIIWYCVLQPFSKNSIAILCIHTYTYIFLQRASCWKHYLFYLKDGVSHNTTVSYVKINIAQLGPPNMNGTEEHRTEF